MNLSTLKTQWQTKGRSKWDALTAREQIFLASGTLAVLLFILIYGIILPIHHHTKALKETVSANKELLAWMQTKGPQLKALNKPNNLSTGHALGKKSLLSLFSSLEIFFDGNAFKNFKPTLNSTGKNAGKDQVSVHFNEVPFDVFMNGLMTLQSQNNIFIVSIDIQSLEAPGLVKIEAVFSH